MPRATHENTRVYWATAIADAESPTSQEIAAATDLTDQIPVDGVALNNTKNNASQPMLGDAFVAELVGTWGTQITVTFTRDDADDVAFDLFDYRTNGYLIISRFGAPTSGDSVEVYPAQSHSPSIMATAENEFQKFEVEMAVTDTPSIHAVVDGS